jgi:hypothetical protein
MLMSGNEDQLLALHRSGDNGFPYNRLTLSELANSPR